MKKNIKYLITFLFFFLPFEDLIISNLPISGNFKLLGKQFSDVVLFIIYCFYFSKINEKFKSFKILLFFMIYSIMINIYHSTGIEGILNVKSIVRFIPLVYIVSDLDFKLGVFKKNYFVIILIQVFISLIQLISQDIGLVFKPVNIETEMITTNFSAAKNQLELSGTFSTTIALGYFLILYKIFFNYSKPINILIIVILFFAGSKINFFVFLLISIHHLIKNYRKILIPVSLSIVSTVYMGVMFFYSNLVKSIQYENNTSFLAIFSIEFWIHFIELQRGALFTFIIYPLLTKSQIIFGYGSAKSKFPELIEQKISFINYEFYAQIVEDIYLLAFVLYFGVIGLILFSYFLKNLRIDLMKVSMISLQKFDTILILIIFTSLFNQSLEVKGFSFYLWFCIGLFLNEKNIKNENIISA